MVSGSVSSCMTCLDKRRCMAWAFFVENLGLSLIGNLCLNPDLVQNFF
jgi:hypothetical protein